MPRAQRHFLPGYAWHITHRCHKKEFLFKFSIDRQRWLHWLFEAKKRYRLSILNYTVTSNHIHLLVMNNKDPQAIPKSMQLIAGRTAQEFNRRKDRKGAFWEDRYHATIVETGEHLVQCIAYMDCNMVRAGVVKHPSEWPQSGYDEIQSPRQRYTLIDHGLLTSLLGLRSPADLQKHHREYVGAYLSRIDRSRESKWSESIAVGSRDFIEKVHRELGVRAKGRRIAGSSADSRLCEPQSPYTGNLGGKKRDLRS
jgi:REP element-mobilizing transposase RayT